MKSLINMQSSGFVLQAYDKKEIPLTHSPIRNDSVLMDQFNSNFKDLLFQ